MFRRSAPVGCRLICNVRLHFSTRSQMLRPVSDEMEADLEQFGKLQNVISDYLNGNDSSKANAM